MLDESTRMCRRGEGWGGAGMTGPGNIERVEDNEEAQRKRERDGRTEEGEISIIPTITDSLLLVHQNVVGHVVASHG